MKEFIGNTYTYPEKPGKNKDKFNVNCKIHGLFLTTPGNHKAGRGCPQCARENRKGPWTNTNWEEMGKESKCFDGFKVYFVECFKGNESFIKIGKTFREIKKRFEEIPYKFSILVIKDFNTAKECTNYEKEIHSKYKNFKYLPLDSFGGMYECFNISIKNEVLNVY